VGGCSTASTRSRRASSSRRRCRLRWLVEATARVEAYGVVPEELALAPLGHLPGEHPLPACYCGRAGCIETYLSGPALEREHAALTGEARSAKEIAALDGEALARYIERLARAAASVINVLDPDVIV